MRFRKTRKKMDMLSPDLSAEDALNLIYDICQDIEDESGDCVFELAVRNEDAFATTFHHIAMELVVAMYRQHDKEKLLKDKFSTEESRILLEKIEEAEKAIVAYQNSAKEQAESKKSLEIALKQKEEEKRKLETIQTENNEIKKAIERLGTIDIPAAECKRDDLRKAAQEKENDKKDIICSIKDAETKISNLRITIEEKKHEMSEVGNQLEEVGNQLEELDNTLKQKQMELKILKDDKEQKTNLKNKIEQEIANLQKSIEELHTAKNKGNYEELKETLELEKSGLEFELSEARKVANGLTQTIEGLKTRLKNLKTQNLKDEDVQRDTITQLNEEDSRHQKEMGKLKNRITELNKVIAECSGNRTKYEEEMKKREKEAEEELARSKKSKADVDSWYDGEKLEAHRAETDKLQKYVAEMLKLKQDLDNQVAEFGEDYQSYQNDDFSIILYKLQGHIQSALRTYDDILQKKEIIDLSWGLHIE